MSLDRAADAMLRRLADLVRRLVDAFLARPADEGQTFDAVTTTPGR
ncbi:hypothetical protein [Streptomyces sp. NBC_01334]|nr:hypothetical protein OG736_03775 [Streptomyces sp. NBC_01334]